MFPNSYDKGGHTGLGEEGGESMVVVRSLALFGEVSVGLNAMFEAVQLFTMPGQYVVPLGSQISPMRSYASSTSRSFVVILTSQQLLAIWQPAWPTRRVECQ